MNLKRADPDVDVDELQEAVGWEFLNSALDDEKQEHMSDGECQVWGFQMVRPDEGWFPGLDKLRQVLPTLLRYPRKHQIIL